MLPETQEPLDLLVPLDLELQAPQASELLEPLAQPERLGHLDPERLEPPVSAPLGQRARSGQRVHLVLGQLEQRGSEPPDPLVQLEPLARQAPPELVPLAILAQLEPPARREPPGQLV